MASIKTQQQLPLKPPEPDTFLFQAQARLDAVVAQVVVQRAFDVGEARQVMPNGVGFFPPMGFVRKQGVAVHQKRAHMREVCA